MDCVTATGIIFMAMSGMANMSMVIRVISGFVFFVSMARQVSNMLAINVQYTNR